MAFSAQTIDNRRTAKIMNRRRFLVDSTAVIAGAMVGRRCFAEAGEGGAAGPVKGELTVDLDSASYLIPANYCGFSYELAQLMDPNFFAASNKELIAFFRLLTPQGVLRLGGNTSESCWFKVDDSVTAPEIRPAVQTAAENWMPQQAFEIDPPAIDNLAEFLQATDWKLIYGMAFGHSSPERAAREAEYVAKKVGDRLLYFQIGNEPDLYHNPQNKTRPPDWSFDDYLKEWLGYAEAIRARVPNAKFGGPDVAASSDWIPRFTKAAEAKLGNRFVAATGHYYAEGPPDDPRMTTGRLLRGDPQIAVRTKSIADAAAKDGLVYRMTEGNSCYRGGKPGMSDALAGALWGSDYLLTLATNGCAGVNLHGGSGNAVRASLGNHMPGESLAPGKKVKGSFYTPIAGSAEEGFEARPIFYGMMLANQFAGAKVRPVKLAAEDVNATAYAAEKDDQLRVAIFNKDGAKDLALNLRMPPGYKRAKVWRLTGPALDSPDVTLAGATVSPAATWSPTTVETPQIAGDGAELNIPRASAALVFWER
jgi:hypothetical protein